MSVSLKDSATVTPDEVGMNGYHQAFGMKNMESNVISIDHDSDCSDGDDLDYEDSEHEDSEEEDSGQHDFPFYKQHRRG